MAERPEMFALFFTLFNNWKSLGRRCTLCVVTELLEINYLFFFASKINVPGICAHSFEPNGCRMIAELVQARRFSANQTVTLAFCLRMRFVMLIE